MHYLVNGSTPYPLNSYYTAYAAGTQKPKCTSRGGRIGDFEKLVCDISEDYIIKNIPGGEGNKEKAREGLRGAQNPFQFVGQKAVDSNPVTKGLDQMITSGVSGNWDIGKYWPFVAAGGGILLFFMLMMMFKR